MNKERKITKLLAILMIALLSVGLIASCGSSQDATEGKTTEDVLKEATANMQNAKSISSTNTIEMGIKVMGMEINFDIGGELESTKDPVEMHASYNFDMGVLGSYDMELYAVEEDGKYVAYVGTSNESGEMVWESDVSEYSPEDVAQMDNASLVGTTVDIAKNFEEGVEETIDGVKTIRYDGFVSGEDIGKILEQVAMAGELSDMTGMGDTADAAEDLKDTGDMPISIWIDTNKMLPVKYTVDMSQVMASIMEQAMEEAGTAGDEEQVAVEISKMMITVNITDYDNVSEIVVPDEAKAVALDTAA